MKLGYMIVGCIFLFNPFINIIDILPDFIGYLFILRALFELSDLERNILSARKKFKAAMWVSLVKALLVFASMIFDSTWYLILTFTFGILECMYLIPGFIDLFYGISYLEARYTNHKSRFEAKPKYGGTFDKTEFADGTAYFELFTEKSEEILPLFEESVRFGDHTETVRLADAGFASKFREKIIYFYESAEARIMSVIFIFVRSAAACLPELTAIAETGTGYVESNPINDYSAMRWLLIFLLAIFALIVGIVWLVRMIRYFNTFRKDTEFLSALKQKYDAEILPNKGLWVKRKSLSFCAVATAAYAFLMCFRIDWFLLVPKWEANTVRIAVYDILAFFPVPEFLFGVVMIFTAFAAKNFAEQNKKSIIQNSVFFTVSSALAYLAVFFLSKEYGKLIYPYKENGYLLLFAAYLILFAVSMYAFYRISREKQTVYLRLAQEITDISCPAVHDFSERKRKELMTDFGKKIKKHHILEAVYAVASVVLTLGMPFSEDYDLCGLFWFFRLIFGVALIVNSLLLTDSLQKEIEKIVE